MIHLPCSGLDGCISDVTIGRSNPVILYDGAIEGINVESCRLRKRKRRRRSLDGYQREGDDPDCDALTSEVKGDNGADDVKCHRTDSTHASVNDGIRGPSGNVNDTSAVKELRDSVGGRSGRKIAVATITNSDGSGDYGDDKKRHLR